MKKIISGILGSVLVLSGAIHLSAEGPRHWTKIDPASVPWEKPITALSQFNGHVLVSAKTRKSGDGIFIWKTTDGLSWEPVPVSGIGTVQEFTEHKGYFYALSVDLTVDEQNPPRSIYRTTDLITWQELNFNFGTGLWSDAISHAVSGKSYLYVTGAEAQIWRTEGGAGDPSWKAIAGQDCCDTSDMFRFASLGEVLYKIGMLSGTTFGIAQYHQAQVFYSQNGTSWDYHSHAVSGFDSNINGYFGPFVDYKGDIFWPLKNELKINPENLKTLNWPVVLVTNDPVPIKMHGDLYVLNESGPVRKYVSSSVWESIGLTTPPMCLPPILDVLIGVPQLTPDVNKFDETPTLNGKAFVPLCDLWMIKKGIISIDPKPPTTETLSFGQKGAAVLGWSVKINMEEKMKGLTIVNKGDSSLLPAEHGTEIEKMTLNLSGTDTRIPPVPIADLVPDVNLTSWSLPDGFDLDVKDGDQFLITLDLSENPRKDRSVKLNLTGTQWESGPFSGDLMSDAIESPSFTIQAQPDPVFAPAPIEGVMVYPSPARDAVRFLYDLASSADVDIKVFDINGVLVTTVSDLNKPAQSRSVTVWDASNTAPGVYYALIRILTSQGEEQRFKKLIFIKR